jgi:hypothetical protein
MSARDPPDTTAVEIATQAPAKPTCVSPMEAEGRPVAAVDYEDGGSNTRLAERELGGHPRSWRALHGASDAG